MSSSQQPMISTQLAPGVTFEQIDNIHIFTLADLSRQSIDAWADKVQSVVNDLPDGAPFLAIHHFTSPYATLTPYLKGRSDKIVNTTHPSHTAIILPGSGLVNLVSALLPRLSKGKGARLFTNRDEAINWLRESS